MDEGHDRGPSAGATRPAAKPRRAGGRAARLMLARADVLLCALILAAMSAAMLDTVRRKSLTVDELVMIPAAYYQVAEGDFRFIHEHPPLSKTLAGLPLLFLDRVKTGPAHPGLTAATPEGRAARLNDFWARNGARFRRISYWSRVPLVALTAALGLLVFAFARSLFGRPAAVFAVALFSLEPTVLAHGRVVQTDVPAAFGYLLAVFAVHHYLKKMTAGRALLVGAAGGVAVVAKFSMLIVGPAFAILFAALVWRAGPKLAGRLAVSKHALVAALALFALIWAAYSFQTRPLSADDYGWIAVSLPGHAPAARAAAETLTRLLPTDFVLGIFFQLRHAGEGHPAGLLGQYGRHGWWYYFPVAFALKTTLPFLLLSLASLAWSAGRLWRGRDARFLFLLVPFALYTLYVMASPINIGVRYYLPAFPFLFIAGGALLARLAAWRGAGRARLAGPAACVLLVSWAVAETARAFPHYMSYTNQLAAGGPRWWYLSDSNVEWGDDVRALALYLRARGEWRVGGLFMGAWITLSSYGVEFVNALDPPGTLHPPTRYTAVGASFLNGSTVPPTIGGRTLTEAERVNFFAAYRGRTPEKIFGNSIYLFREDR